jgi:hypothetical protein
MRHKKNDATKLPCPEECRSTIRLNPNPLPPLSFVSSCSVVKFRSVLLLNGFTLRALLAD